MSRYHSEGTIHVATSPPCQGPHFRYDRTRNRPANDGRRSPSPGDIATLRNSRYPAGGFVRPHYGAGRESFFGSHAIISFLDGNRLWFKSHHGLDAPEVSWSPHEAVELRICRAFDLGFFAGVPLTTHDGWNLGTLCVIDRQRRRVDEDHIHHLKLLANIAMDLLELRLSRRRDDARVEMMAGVVDHRAVNSPQLNRSVILGAQSRFADLTPRQREIMELVVAGCPNKIIAVNLGISQRTVESHRAAIMKKTGAKSLPALARLALYVAGFGARELLDLAPLAASAASTITG